MNAQPFPDVYAYTDPLTFLKDAFAYEKDKNPHYTIRQWALDIGFKTPRPLLEIVTRKRPLTPKYVDFLANGLRLNQKQALYLLTLTYRISVQTSLEKALFDQMLFRLAHTDQGMEMTELRTDDPEYLSHWVDTTLTSMTQLKDFEMTEDNIERRLSYKIPQSDIKASLNKLSSKGILREIGSNRFKKAADVICNSGPHLGARKYIEQINELSKKALTVSRNRREFQCFTISVEKQKIQRCKEILQDCRHSLERLASSEGDYVYQANLQLFPMTEPPTVDSDVITSHSHKEIDS